MLNQPNAAVDSKESFSTPQNGPLTNQMDCIEKGNTPITLSIPGTPNPLSTRRASGVQMSAKLAALRGDNVAPREEATFSGERPKNHKKEKNKKQEVRFMQKNGRCNIKQDSGEIHRRYLRDIFTTLVDMRWRSNLLFFISTYIIAWSTFGFLWWLVALNRGDVAYHYRQKSANVSHEHEGSSERVSCVENVYSYTTAFLFFVETETSLGYGKRAITDKCPEAIILFVLQSLLASILDAFMVGSIFIKISQPKNRAETLVFSEHCVISPRDRKYCLMFRVGNLRNSLIVQCRIRAKYVKSRETKEGEFIGLHQDDINVGFDTGADNLFLVTPLIICHEIDEHSPLWTMSADDLRQEQFEIIVILEGMIESTGMICQARTSYLSTEILWGHRFMPVLFHARGHFRVDHSEFHSIYEVTMPRISMRDYENSDKENQSRGQKNGHFDSPTSSNLTGVQKVGRGSNHRQSSTHRNVKQTAISQDTLRATSMDSFKVNSATMRTLSDVNMSRSVALVNEEAHASSSTDKMKRKHNSNRDEYTERRRSDDTMATLLKSGADMAL
uniref:G protein-activated inward rectifier potassium channel 4 n=1 Tax=Phallusia mammillata TaxID=59560 RepID=A0A6F9DEW7_9ASCI|nr:G protein-activated inward rectifier potassium channel 4 [Phallusia mammillata]